VLVVKLLNQPADFGFEIGWAILRLVGGDSGGRRQERSEKEKGNRESGSHDKTSRARGFSLILWHCPGSRNWQAAHSDVPSSKKLGSEPWARLASSSGLTHGFSTIEDGRN